MTPSQRRSLKSMGSSQGRQFVASYKHGKQRRTKARKEETEEAKNLIAKTLSNPRHASSESRRTMRVKHRVAGYSALTFERIRAPHSSRLAKDGFFWLSTATSSRQAKCGAIAFPPRPPRLLRQCYGQVTRPKAPTWCQSHHVSFRKTNAFLLDNSTPGNDHQKGHKDA